MLIRADASVSIGTGHVMRTLSLAQLWLRDGGRVTLVAAELPLYLERRLRAEGIDVCRIDVPIGQEEDAEETVKIARAHGATWVVVDGYNFNVAFHQAIRKNALKLLVIDDFAHLPFYSGDIIVNPNLLVPSPSYTTELKTRILTGPKYVLLRREFWNRNNWQRHIQDRAERLLITMGGSDPHNATAAALKLIENLSVPLKVSVAVGGANRNVQNNVSRSKHSVTYYFGVNDMVPHWAEADVALIGAGNSLWEALYMGVPTLSIARNNWQRALIETLEDIGLVRHIDLEPQPSDQYNSELALNCLHRLITSRRERRMLSINGRHMIDGRGVFRIVAVMKQW